MKESTFRRDLCAKLRTLQCDAQAIEATTGAGIPDVNACYKGIEFWLELKLFKSKSVLIRPAQNAWAYRRRHAGGLVFLMAYCPQRKEIHLWKAPKDFKMVGNLLKVLDKPDKIIIKKDFNIEFILE